MLRSFAFFLLSFSVVLITGCEKTTTTGSGIINCLSQEMDRLTLTATFLPTGEVIPLEVNDAGRFTYEDFEGGEYRFDLKAYDSTGAFLLFDHGWERNIPIGSGSLNFSIVGAADWVQVDIEDGNFEREVVFRGLNAMCVVPGVIRTYASDTDPSTWEDPNAIFSEEYLFGEVSGINWVEIRVPFEEDQVFIAFETQNGNQWVRAVPQQFLADQKPAIQLNLTQITGVHVSRTFPTWIMVNLDDDVSCLIEYFDFDANGSTGRDLLLSCYSGDTSHTYFEKRPLRKPDGTPAMIFKHTTGMILLKAELSETGTPGEFGFFIRREASSGGYGLDQVSDLSQFSFTHQRFHEELGPGTYTFSSYETHPENRAVRYTLVNETTGEPIVFDGVPSEDIFAPNTHSFTLSETSHIQLSVMKAYWGDFQNEVHFSLD